MHHFSSITPSKTFYGSVFLKLLRIARCTKIITGSIPTESEFFQE